MPAPSVPLDAIRQPAFLYDAGGRIVAANDLADALAGRSLAGLSPEDVVRLFRPRRPYGEPLAPAELPISRALAGGEAVDVPFAVATADGRTVHVLATASPLRDGDAVTGALAIWQDVSASAAAKRALEESRARYRALIETNADFIWEMDATGRYTYCSPQMERLWGIDPATMLGRTPFDMMPEAERERALASFAAMASAPSGFSGLEMDSCDGRGRPISLEIAGVPFIADDGALLGYRGITRDVTERKRSEDALRESEERLRLAQESAGLAIWDRDMATDRVTVAPEFVRRYLVEPEAMQTYADWERFIHPGDRATVEAGRQAALAAGGPLDIEFRVVIPPDEVRWIHLKGKGMIDGSGTLSRVIGVIIDVTERRRAEEALAESEADARAFFENMVDPCAVCEMVVNERGEPEDIRLVDVNPAFERALSLPARLIVGQTAFMILPALHRQWLDLFLEVSRQRMFIQVEDPYPALDRWYHVTGFPVRNGRVAVIFRDITVQRAA